MMRYADSRFLDGTGTNYYFSKSQGLVRAPLALGRDHTVPWKSQWIKKRNTLSSSKIKQVQGTLLRTPDRPLFSWPTLY